MAGTITRNVSKSAASSSGTTKTVETNAGLTTGQKATTTSSTGSSVTHADPALALAQAAAANTGSSSSGSTTVNSGGFSNSSGKFDSAGGTTVNSSGGSNSSGTYGKQSLADAKTAATTTSSTGSSISHADPALALAQAQALANAKPAATTTGSSGGTTVNSGGYSHSSGSLGGGSTGSSSAGNDIDNDVDPNALVAARAAAAAQPNDSIFIPTDSGSSTGSKGTSNFDDILKKALEYVGGGSGSSGSSDSSSGSSSGGSTGSGGKSTGGSTSGGTGSGGSTGSGGGTVNLTSTNENIRISGVSPVLDPDTGKLIGYLNNGVWEPIDSGTSSSGSGSGSTGTPNYTVNSGTPTDIQAIIDAYTAANSAAANGNYGASGTAPDVQAIIDAYKRANANAGNVNIDLGSAVNVPDTPDLKPLLDQWRQVAEEQEAAKIDYATQQGINELQRAMEDAQPQFRSAQEQIDAEEAVSKDNQALYAEARGDKGGIGAAQYDNVMNTAALNRQAVREEQTKLATDTWRQIADLRAQGEYQKADALLQVAQTYLSNLMSLEQWAANYGLSAAQMRESIREWEANYKAQIAEMMGSYNGQKTLAARNAELSAEMQAAQIAESIREWENNYKAQIAEMMGAYDGQKTLAARNAEANLNLEAAKVNESIREWEKEYEAKIADMMGAYNGQATLAARTAAASSNNMASNGTGSAGSTRLILGNTNESSTDTSGYSQVYNNARTSYLNGTMSGAEAAAVMEAANRAANEARGLGSVVTANEDIAAVRNGTLKG